VLAKFRSVISIGVQRSSMRRVVRFDPRSIKSGWVTVLTWQAPRMD
jgi:hypothetical protein